MPYSYVTLAQAQTDLVSRLYDPQGQFGGGSWFWSSSELTSFIQEALRTWNAFANYFRSEFAFQLSQGVVWYDITNTTTAPNTLRAQTLTDNSLIQAIELHLLEPTTPNYPLVWTGSSQFNVSQIVTSLNSSRQEILGTTGCQITRSLIPSTIGRIFMSDTTIDIRRIAWLPVAGFGFPSASPLYLADIESEQNFDPGWTTKPQGQPTQYLVSTEPPLSFDVDRVPATNGNYEVLSVSAGSAFSTTSASLVGLPDDWAWLAKWGALSQLLSGASSPSDPLRASYCRRRFEDGLSILKTSPAILGLRLNNIPLQYDAVRNADLYSPGWQALAQATPNTAYIVGLNLLGFSPPDASLYSITVSCVQNAPVPSLQGDFLQIGRDDYDTILDYAQHLALFKVGGKIFQDSLPLLENFFERAATYNAKLLQSGIFQKPMFEISQLNAERNPVYVER